MASLTVQIQDSVLHKYGVGPAAATIGRQHDNAIVLDDDAVSSHHACVFRDGDDFILEDLQSTNGTFVNGKRVSRCKLDDHDVVAVGGHTLVFDQFAEDGSDRATHSPAVRGPFEAAEQLLSAANGETVFVDARTHQRALTILMNAQARAAAEAAPPATVGVLRVLAGRTDESEYTLNGHTSLIGKAPSALIRVKGWWFAPAVSLAVTRNRHGYVATRLGGKVRINDCLIHGRHDLKDGDVVRVGGLRLEFRLKGPDMEQATPGASASPSIAL
jgi:pSer/pThr/pTyr-binding forkhead associated (FHA) protein